jgi:multiple sugar transport system substrate-binding protein
MRQGWLIVGLVVLSLSGLGLGGCSRVPEGETGTPGTGAASGPGKEIVLFTWTARDEEQVNLELIEKFEAQHPGLKVRLQNETGGSQAAMSKLQTMLAANEAPDVMSLHGAFFIPLAAKGVLMDLDRLDHADLGFDTSDWSAPLLEVCRYEGTLYSLPRYTSVYTLFYNKTLFDAARLPYPASGQSWTWDDYLQTAQALTRDTDGDGRTDQWGCIIDFWGARMYPWLWQAGGALLNPEHDRCVLDSPEARAAVSFLYDLKYKHQVAASSESTEQNAALTAFTQGKIGMYMTGPWDIQLLRQAQGLQWEVAPLPARQQQATLLGTENYAIWQGTRYPDEAWTFFKYLMSSEVQQLMAERLEKMPSRQSVLNGPYREAETDHNRAVFVEALTYARQAENIPEWSQVKDLIQDQFDLIWIGKKSVTKGLQDATSQVNRTLTELRSKK